MRGRRRRRRRRRRDREKVLCTRANSVRYSGNDGIKNGNRRFHFYYTMDEDQAIVDEILEKEEEEEMEKKRE